jgi:hypothetical protein
MTCLTRSRPDPTKLDAPTSLAGMDLRCDGGNGDLELFNGVEASCTPLSSYPLAVLGNSGVQRAMEIHQVVGVSVWVLRGSFWLF